jgi:transforming growth factor-beta-induced protein
LNLTHTTTSFNLTSFQGALYASSEIDTFSSTPNTTIFAPNNEAFQALGGAISSMTVEELTTILDYHMLPTDVIYSTGLTNGTKFVTKQGGNITVTHIGNKVYINSAQLLTTDILVSNGVVHVIDNVLNPTSTGGQPNPTLATQIPVFASASSIRSVPFTSAIPCTSSCPVSSASGTGAATGTGAGSRATSTSSRSTGVSTGTSKAQAVAMARETGMGAAGLMAMIGGAVMMI